MATAPSPQTRSRRQARSASAAAPRWRRWLLLGLFFGLGHGLTQRVLEMSWGEGSDRPPAFRAMPPSGGATLEQLRQQHGEKAKPLTADLEALARQKREEQDKAEAAKREEAARQKAALQQEKDRLQSEGRRVEEFNAPPEPAGAEPIRQENTFPATPPTPQLPPPEPFAAEPLPPSPSQAPTGAAPSQP